VQREIILKAGPVKSNDDMYFNDGTWSEGLVSAARLVASATQDLCESANEAAKGGSNSRDKVIVAAKTVSATTAQLLTSAVAKADSQSQAQIRLKAAGKAVSNATNQLVKASEESKVFTETDEMSNTLMDEKSEMSETSSKVMEMEAQMSILKMEKELEKARSKLANVRKGKYEMNLSSKNNAKNVK